MHYSVSPRAGDVVIDLDPGYNVETLVFLLGKFMFVLLFKFSKIDQRILKHQKLVFFFNFNILFSYWNQVSTQTCSASTISDFEKIEVY